MLHLNELTLTLPRLLLERDWQMLSHLQAHLLLDLRGDLSPNFIFDM